YSNYTGLTVNTGATSPTLLPTPTANEWKGAAGRKRHTQRITDHVRSLSLPEDSHVSPSRPLDEERERMTTAISGRT
ncbi:hypothetical protein QSH86_25105, partial [Escherichia coli]